MDKENVAPIATRGSKSRGEQQGLVHKMPSGTDGTSLPRLLLFTERADEVFLLNDGLPEVSQRRQLSEAVMADRGNPTIWWSLLQHVNKHFANDVAHAPQVRKLYQKATRIIPDKANKDNQALTNIWLGFASAESKAVSEQDAREAYEHMKLSGIGADVAAFYLAYAALEEQCHRSKEALQILELAIRRGVSPTEEIQSSILRLRGLVSSSSSSSPTITYAPVKTTPEACEGGSRDCSSSSGDSTTKRGPTLVLRPSISPVTAAAASGDTTLSFSLEDIGDALTSVINLRDRSAAGRSPSTESTPPAPTSRDSTSPSGNTIEFNIPDQQHQHNRTAAAAPTSRDSTSFSGNTIEFNIRDQLDLHNRTGVVSFKPQSHHPQAHGNAIDENHTGMITFKALHTPKASSSSASAAAVSSSSSKTPSMPPPPSSEKASSSAEAAKTRTKSTSTSDSNKENAQKRPAAAAAKPKRMLPTGLLGKLGGAQRVRTEPSSSSSSTSSSSKPATSDSATADASKPKEEGKEGGGSDVAALGRLQPIDEDATIGKGQEDTIGVGSGAKHYPDDRKSTHEISFRIRKSDGGQEHVAASSSASYCCRQQAGGENRHPSNHPSPHPVQQHHHPGEALSITRAGRGRSAGEGGRGGGGSDGRRSGEREDRTRSGSGGSSSSAKAASSSDQFSFDSLLNSRNIVTLNDSQYLRLDVLGRGGSSKVFRVLSDVGQIYALKRVRVPPKDSKALESFANEITLLSRLRGHPCIIQLMDSVVDRSTGLVYMLMELGEIDLSKLLTQSAAEGKLSLNFIRFTWEQMLRAVHCVHEERIVHGDLKPANFVFVKGRLKLIDFGIAKAIGNDTTNIMRESQVGTVNYMSPEAILDTGNGIEQPGTGRRAPCMKIGRASDVWSLGCILYQLMYGKTPFADLNLIQKLHCIVNETYQIPFPTTIEYDVMDIIQQCLRRDPTTRPPIAGGEGNLLEHVFLHPSSHPPSSSSASEGVAGGGGLAGNTSSVGIETGGMKKTIEATLSILDKDPDMMRLEARQRLGVVYQRVSSLVNPPLPPSSSSSSHKKPPAPRAPSSSSTSTAATSVTAGNRPTSLTEQIVSQRSKLRPVDAGGRNGGGYGGAHGGGGGDRRPALSPGGLRSMFEKGLAGIRAANVTHNSDITGGSTCHDTGTWSFN